MKPGDLVKISNQGDPEDYVDVELWRVVGLADGDDYVGTMTINMVGLVLAVEKNGINKKEESLVLAGETYGWCMSSELELA